MMRLESWREEDKQRGFPFLKQRTVWERVVTWGYAYFSGIPSKQSINHGW
jgi:hypothetical protein